MRDHLTPLFFMRYTIALFGEAEKGDFSTILHIRSLSELADTLGSPPDESQAIHFAIQAMLYERELIFVRVKEEGFSTRDYLRGLKLLQLTPSVPPITAICLPGVGDEKIIDASNPLLTKHKSFLIVNQTDLYDYLTCFNPFSA